MENKTNVLRILDKKRINYECVEYEMKDEYSAADIADILKIPRSEVFKTLVLVGKSNNFYVFIAPSDKEIDMKKAAKVVGEKAVVMLWSKLLLEITGYVHGGCSPIGMKKPFVTIMDKSAQNQESIYVNGGRRGLMIKIAPMRLETIVKYAYADITQEKSEK